MELTASMIRFTVLGKPETAGSKRAFMPKGARFPVVVDDNPKSRGWKNDVRNQARGEYDGELLDGPLKVTLRFYRKRPTGHFGSGKNASVVKASAPATPISKPDVLKLARAVEDALTGVLWRDDAQIVVEVLEKHYGEPERVEIEVEAIA